MGAPRDRPSFTRITAKDPLYVVDGEACIVFSPLAVCSFMPYWRSIAYAAQPGLPLAPDAPITSPTLYFGGAIALGFAGATAH